jgi:septal ring factor EnvC (AmiA/AmiB activator)
MNSITLESVLKLRKQFEETVKMPLLIFILLLSLVGSVFSALYLAVNFNQIPSKIAKTTIVEGKNQQGETENAVHKSGGLFKKTADFFKGISIDLSAVTPFLLFLFFYCTSTGILKLLLKPAKTQNTIPEHYPFPKNYGTTWIQLGFIGTLWAFFLIGLRMARIRNVGGVELVDILTKAFGTAIISTLTAVVLVYLFCPIVKKSLRWAFDIPSLQPMDAIEKRLSELCTKISLACTETEKSQEHITQLGDCMNYCSKQIETFSAKIEKLSETGFMKGIVNIQQPLNAIEKQLNELSAKMSLTCSETEKSRESITKLVETSENQVKLLNGLTGKADETISKEKKMVENLQNISQNLQQFTNTFDSKLDKIIETFKTESQEKQKNIATAQENFQEKVNGDFRFTIRRIINLLRALIKKTKSSLQENVIETQNTIEQMKSQTRTFLETEFSRIADEIEDMKDKIVEIERHRKSADKKMNKLNDKYKGLKSEKKSNGSWQSSSEFDAVEE